MENIKKNPALAVFGFSCTDTADGYAEFLIKKLKNIRADMRIDRYAFGGLAPPIVPALLRKIIKSKRDITHVLLEISTSIYQWLDGATEAAAREIVSEVISVCVEEGVHPIFLLLYRNERKVITCDINEIIKVECLKKDVMFIDLASDMNETFGMGWLERHYRDDVHTNETGGRSQASMILPIIKYFLEKPTPSFSTKRKYNKNSYLLPVHELKGIRQDGNFTRKDYEAGYARIESGEAAVIELDCPKLIIGFSFVYGPWSGDIRYTAETDRGEVTGLATAFDERSYYERLGFKSFDSYRPINASKITFTYSNPNSDVRLLKGTTQLTDKHIRIVDLFLEEEKH